MSAAGKNLWARLYSRKSGTSSASWSIPPGGWLQLPLSQVSLTQLEPLPQSSGQRVGVSGGTVVVLQMPLPQRSIAAAGPAGSREAEQITSVDRAKRDR